MHIIYGFGYNGFGQLVLNGDDCLFVPKQCVITENTNKKCGSQWSSLLFIKDGSIIFQGFHGGRLQKIEIGFDQFKQKGREINEIINTGDGLGVLTDVGEFSLFQFSEHETSVKDDHEVDLLYELENVKVASVNCKFNQNKILLVTDAGNILVLEKQLKLKQFNLMPEIKMKNPVVGISCGKDHCLAVTSDGKLYSWGIGSRGQLGLGHTGSTDEPTTIEALGGVKIKRVSCGGWHSIALADTNDLYVWGWNESGQTGFPAPKNIFSTSANMKTKVQCNPHKSSFDNDSCIPTRTCKTSYNIEDGNDNAHHETAGMILSPQLLELESYITANKGEFISIVDVDCGSRHTAALTSASHVITWGWAKYGQLGHACCVRSRDDSPCDAIGGQRGRGSELEIAPTCRSVSHPPGVAVWFQNEGIVTNAVTCGHWNTFAHVQS